MTASTVAQTIVIQRSAPDEDRWNYPFNASVGFRTSASTFAAPPGDPAFDDRDAQFLIGWDTSAEVTPGLAPTRYEILSATVTVTTISGGVFVFDPTTDDWRTHLDPADPMFIADADAGRPIELFGVGFRNGFDAQTWTEFSPFQQAPFGNWQGTRNAFATDNEGRSGRDISRHVEQGFTPTPFAVGQASGVAQGASVPFDTPWTFALDVADADVLAYLRESLRSGRLRLMVTSMHPAPTMGQGAQNWPDYYTRENKFAIPLGFAATLDLTVRIGSGADLNGDGVVNGGDITVILNQFGGPGDADLNGDGVVNGSDITVVLNSFGA
ncbi:MAG: hypothetical protein D6693_02470 [Planctomycetota bacterium]|nr:MAG: hypothetical protein D6693_02470 [Planctomycetota bacterium]